MTNIYNEAIQVHDVLNPKIWNEDNQLKGVVREKLLAIVNQFIGQLDIELNIADIQLVGSNASYNYTDTSDIDLHIITNFDLYECPEKILSAYFNAKKTNFNKQYDFYIKGLNVELYIEDIKGGVQSNGIYSVLNNEWIKFPKHIDYNGKTDFSAAVNRWQNRIDAAIASNDTQQLTFLLNKIYLIRKNSLAADGEWGLGNLLFKEVRNAGLLDKMRDALHAATSRNLSMESLVSTIGSAEQGMNLLNSLDI